MCTHEHLKTVGHRLFCMDCSAELPLEFLTKKKEPTKKRPAKKKQ